MEWRENGLLVKNNATHIITNTSLEQEDMYRHNLTVSVANITSSLNYSAVFNGDNWRIASNSIIVHGECYYSVTNRHILTLLLLFLVDPQLYW